MITVNVEGKMGEWAIDGHDSRSEFFYHTSATRLSKEVPQKHPFVYVLPRMLSIRHLHERFFVDHVDLLIGQTRRL